MATETERIKKLFKNNWNGLTWHGTNLQQTLEGISWQQSFKKPAGFVHNIYEYVMHINCWRTFVLQHLQGNYSYTVELNSETDWVKDYGADGSTWQAALLALEKNQEALSSALENIKEDSLDELVPGKKFKWYIFLHGIIEHDIYHSAQIALLKRATAG